MKLLLSLAILTALALPVRADEIPQCAPPPGVTATTTLSSFPLPIAHSLAHHVPNLAPPEASFNGGDALLGGKTQLYRRLITTFHRNNRWVIAYEAAGIGYHHVVVAYDVTNGGKNSHIVFMTQSFPTQTCATMARALAQAPIDRSW